MRPIVYAFLVAILGWLALISLNNIGVININIFTNQILKPLHFFKMIISTASINDILELTNLVNNAYRGETAKKGWTNESHLLEGTRIDETMFHEYFNDPTITILKGIDKDDKIIACVHLQQQGNQLYLGMLTVKPELQTAGIGKTLLQSAEAHAKQLKCNTIKMSVISIRHELIAYYQRRGYFITGETIPFPNEREKFGKPKMDIELMMMEKLLFG